MRMAVRKIRIPKSISEFTASSAILINQVTGYDKCEALKQAVQDANLEYQRLRDSLTRSRSTFAQAIASRSACQKDLNNLLQRKQSWNDGDLMRFTELYRAEMRLEQEESQAKQANEGLEKAVDHAHANLMECLRERYQGEQLWSDKIRRASTMGTIALMIANLGLFLALQLIVEPRKRKRLLADFEERLSQGLILQQSQRIEIEPEIITPQVNALPEQEVHDPALVPRDWIPVSWQPWWDANLQKAFEMGVEKVQNPWMVSTVLACLLSLSLVNR